MNVFCSQERVIENKMKNVNLMTTTFLIFGFSELFNHSRKSQHLKKSQLSAN